MSPQTGARTIVVGVTGSIAAYKAADLIRALRAGGYAVTVVMTPDATRFITPLTLQTLSARQVITDMFSVTGEWTPAHVSLADEAVAIVIAPASAHCIAQLAAGRADDMLSCTVLSTRAPVIVAPAMNDRMYTHAAVTENLARLRHFGYHIVEPVHGDLACGRKGTGHLAPTEDIVRTVRTLIEK